jgi:high-affinity nickel-transport protein
MLTAVMLGFVLGLRHAFDPDHVIAVGTIVARRPGRHTASWIGACWGLGHSATILAIGALVIALQVAIPERFARTMELSIGVILVVLGAANLLAARADGAAHAPAHDAPLGASLARSGAVGLAHGLAGSAPIALLAMAAMPSAGSALAYLLVFGLGTTAAMTAFSLVLAAPFAGVHATAPLRRWLTVGTGLVSVGFGAWMIYEIGFAVAARGPV